MEYANGDVYYGNWADNLPNGQGSLTCVSGVVYTGSWQSGQVINIMMMIISFVRIVLRQSLIYV